MAGFERELAVAQAAAREAGAAILRHYEAAQVAMETKPDGSPVTAADREADAIIVARLRSAFPADAILTEESPDDGTRATRSRVWIVDPLDGTRDFLARTGDFCVHVGLAVGGEAVVGVVYQPVADALHAARRRGGATVDRGGDVQPLRASTREAAGEVRVGVSRLLNPDDGLSRCLAAAGLAPRAVPMGASTKYMAVARGDLDAALNLSMGEMEWDTCAPEVILREAGCNLTDGDGLPFRYNQADLFHRRGTVVSNGRCHALMLRVMAPCLPVPL